MADEMYELFGSDDDDADLQNESADISQTQTGWVHTLSKERLRVFPSFISAWSLGIVKPSLQLDHSNTHMYEEIMCIPYVYASAEREIYFDIKRFVKFLAPAENKVMFAYFPMLSSVSRCSCTKNSRTLLR